MTHPLVSAFRCLDSLNDEYLFDCSSVDEAMVVTSKMRTLQRFVDEVMASIPQISGFVGFLESSEGEPLLIWLWPLSLGYEQYFWIEDQTFSRPFSL